MQREYWSHFGERLGFLPRSFTRTKAGSIWLHAVSVGEVASTIPLIEAFRREQPLVPIYVSTSTIAGRNAAERDLDSIVTGIFYCPVDYVSCVRRVLRTIRPALVVVLETEIWPNLFAETKETCARLTIVNGRISDRTWPRYKRAKWFFAPILQLTDAVYVQSTTDYDRYAEAGVSASKLHTEANLKYDASVARAPLPIETYGAEQVWIAASTVGPNERGSLERHAIDEDEIVIKTFQTLTAEFPRLLLVLAPRQPARFEEVAQKLERKGIPFLRRTDATSRRTARLELPGVLLLDTIGELSRVYSAANVVFVGGSIAPRGGHNVIEPAAWGVPVVVGPHMENFEAVMADFVQAGAVVQIKDADHLLPMIRELLVSRERAGEVGSKGRQLVERQRGVSRRLVANFSPLYWSANLRSARGLIVRMVLSALAWAWRIGGAMRMRRYEAYANAQPALPAPVISIGGITVGGSGKTPFTVYLASRLSDQRFAPAILTRGYRRRSPAKSLVIAPATKVPVALTGDEAQIFLRAAVAPLGIGANRYQTAEVLLSHFPSTNVLLLDDGFQHRRLKRDVDIVLIDGLDPFGEDAVVPEGRLREPLSALERADVMVVTRVEDDLRYRAICARLRQFNSTAAIFRTRLVTRYWRDYRTGTRRTELPAQRVAAFCALGNPEAFWRTLESLGLEIVFRWAFNDHHSYKPFELQRIAHQASELGAEMLVTTEKDRINCPSGLESKIAPFNLAWLEIELEVEDDTEFFAHIKDVLRRRAVA